VYSLYEGKNDYGVRIGRNITILTIVRTSCLYLPKTLKTVTFPRFPNINPKPHFRNPLISMARKKANSKKIHRRKSPKEAASHEGSQEASSSHRRSEEAPPFQARNSGAERNQEVPEALSC